MPSAIQFAWKNDRVGPVRYVFLIYADRSGSTLLAKSLASHARDLVVMPEFRLLEILLGEGDESVRKCLPEEFKDLVRLDHQFPNLCISDESLDDIAARSAGKGIKFFIEQIVRAYACNNKINPSVAILKRGSMLRFAHSLLSIYPDATFLHVYRDLRGVTNSSLKSPSPYLPAIMMARGDPLYISLRLSRLMKATDRLRQVDSNRIHEVKYEDFCHEPARNLQKVLAAIGVGYLERAKPGFEFRAQTAEMRIHTLVNKPVEAKRTDAWQKDLIRWQGVATELLAGKMLCQRGYRPYFLPRAKPLTIICSMAIAILWSIGCNASYYFAVAWRLVHNRALLRNRIKQKAVR